MILAARKNDLELCRLLIVEGKADVNAYFESGNSTALTIAVCSSNVALCRLLISEGARVNLCDVDGYTPLHLAAEEGMLEVVKVSMQGNVWCFVVTAGICNLKDTNSIGLC